MMASHARACVCSLSLYLVLATTVRLVVVERGCGEDSLISSRRLAVVPHSIVSYLGF